MDFETNKKELFKMLQSAGREFGIRKASYSKLLKAGEITEEYFKEMLSTMRRTYAFLKACYENASEKGISINFTGNTDAT